MLAVEVVQVAAVVLAVVDVLVVRDVQVVVDVPQDVADVADAVVAEPDQISLMVSQEKSCS